MGEAILHEYRGRYAPCLAFKFRGKTALLMYTTVTCLEADNWISKLTMSGNTYLLHCK